MQDKQPGRGRENRETVKSERIDMSHVATPYVECHILLVSVSTRAIIEKNGRMGE